MDKYTYKELDAELKYFAKDNNCESLSEANGLVNQFLASKIVDQENRLRKLEAKNDNSISIPKTALKNGVLNTDE